VRRSLVKLVFSICHPCISSRMSWLRACLYNYLLIFGSVYAYVILTLRLQGVVLYIYIYIYIYIYKRTDGLVGIYIWKSPLPNGLRCSPYSFLRYGVWDIFELHVCEML
jgi:hypothetical protein